MWAIEVIKGNRRRVVLPDKFPFTVGREGDLFANIPSEIRFDLQDGVLMVCGEDIEVNHNPTQRSMLKRGDRIKVGDIIFKVEKRWLAILKEGAIPFAVGFSLAIIISLFQGNFRFQYKVVGDKKHNCSHRVESLHHKAVLEKKNLHLVMRELKKCAELIEDAAERENLIKMIGQLSFLLNEEFRRLKFKAETAVRDGNVSEALMTLKRIRELSGDASEEIWKYATKRMREIVR